MLMGYKVGYALRRKSNQPKRELIGYLYGHITKEGETPTHTINGINYTGIVLPRLLEITTAHTDFVILQFVNKYSSTSMDQYLQFNTELSLGDYILVTTDGQFRANTNYNNAIDAGTGWYRDIYYYIAGEWKFSRNAGFTFGTCWAPLWCSKNICYGTENTVSNETFLAALKPIPIYE